jgi:hypothetical protein
MTSRGRMIAMLVALALLGCKGVQPTSAASGAGGGASGGSGDGAATSPSSGATRVENVVDPTMDNQVAFYVTIPTKWKFRGVLLQGGVDACDSGFNGVYRATSEDGQSFGEYMPQMSWAYGDGPRPQTGCLPVNKPLSAQDFLKYLSTTMQVAYISDAPMPDALAESVKKFKDSYAQPPNPFYATHNLPPPHNTADGAAAMVRYKKNGVSMEGRLAVMINCSETPHPGFQRWPATISGKCIANASYVTGPENQFAAVLGRWDDPAMGPKQNKEWGDAWMKRHADQMAASEQHFEHEVQGENKAYLDRSNRNFQAQQESFRQAAAVRQQMNNEFINAMQQRTNASELRTADAMQARSTSTSDWVDYALDQKTIMDTNTGAIYKTGNQITPGGAAVQVHGDGTPIH